MSTVVKFGSRINGIKYIDREAVYGLLLKKGKIAVVETPRGYFLPGGGIEQNESHEECLRREIIEEVGIEVKLDEYIGKSVLFDKSPRDNVYYNMYGSFYLVNEVNRLPKLEDDYEMVWMSLEEAKSKLKLIHQIWAVNELFSKKPQFGEVR